MVTIRIVIMTMMMMMMMMIFIIIIIINTIINIIIMFINCGSIVDHFQNFSLYLSDWLQRCIDWTLQYFPMCFQGVGSPNRERCKIPLTVNSC